MQKAECKMQNDKRESKHPRDLRMRTKAFALESIRFVKSMPRSNVTDVIGRQLLRAATSVAANYRAACRARSRKEFIAKLGIVLEEADESQFWLEMVEESGELGGERVRPLHAEAGELVAITVTSIQTASGRRRNSAFIIQHSALKCS